MKNLKDLITESKSGIKCNMFIMNCGSAKYKADEYQLLADLLDPENVYAFDLDKLEEVDDIKSYKWAGPHFDDTSRVSTWINKYKLDGSTNIVLIP